MNDETSARHITKFDGTNFQTWKFQVRAILTAYGLLDIVDGTRAIPANNESAEAKQWIKENAKAMFIISSSMDSKQMESLLVCTSASEMWKKLSSIHEQKSATNKLILTQRFHEYRMDASDSVVNHVAKVQNLAMKLKDVGEEVSPVAIMAKIIASLPTKFNALKTAWDSVTIADQTVDNLIERLIKEELRLTTEDEMATAFAATTISGNRKQKSTEKGTHDKARNYRRNKSEIECFTCNKKGHYARECRKNKKEKESKSSESSVAFVASSTEHESQRINRQTVTTNHRSGNNMASHEYTRKLLEIDTSDVWLMDSGASRHITGRREWFTDYRPCNGETVSLGNDRNCEVVGRGTILINRLVNYKWTEARLEDVLHVPQVKKNLFSVGVCDPRGYGIHFKNSRVYITDNNTMIAEGVKQHNDIYRMFFKVKQAEANVTDLRIWHKRLGHISQQTIKEMAEKGIVHGLNVPKSSKFFCESCQYGKAHRLKFEQRISTAAQLPGEVIYSDVCGPMPVESLGGARFFVNFKDEATGYRHIYFLKHKADVFDRFKEYEAMIKNKFERSIGTLHTDNGLEYCNTKMKTYLAAKGIRFQNTAPYTPEQNGQAERDNRTIVESARTMVHAENLPKFLWAEAVNCATYILNRTISKKNSNSTPYEGWTGKKPQLNHLRIFGSTAYVHTPKQHRTKFDSKAKRTLLVGYQGDSQNYRLYDPQTKRILVSRDVTFNEEVLPLSKEEEDKVILPVDDEQMENENGTQGNVEEIPTNSQNAEDQLKPIEVDVQHQTCSSSRNLRDRNKLQKPKRYELNVAEYVIPNSFQEAISGPEAEMWSEAIKDELKSHKENETWIIVPRNNSHKPVDSRWVFKVLKDTNGDVYRFKARLCARGFQQQFGINYTETFAPVARYDSLRIFLAMVAQLDLEMVQFDIKTAFLHGELEEEVFMEIPEGVSVNQDKREMLCKLQKSLYGLKQAPRCWNTKFRNFLFKFGLKSSEADNCMFCGEYLNETIYLILFVDDGLIAAKSEKVLSVIIKSFRESFDITIGDVHYFAGIEIQRDRNLKTLFIHQKAYITNVINKFKMNDAKSVNVPADPNVVLTPVTNDTDVRVDIPYREAVGSLLFAAIISRPDIAYAVSNVSKYLNRHDINHWNAVKRIIRYLIGTVNFGILYESNIDSDSLNLLGFSDADFASDIETRRSTAGYLFKLAKGPITWSSQREKLVTLSTTESEYVAAAIATKEAVWIRKLLKNLKFNQSDATILFVDNMSAIRLSKNPEFHKRTKHIDVKYHFIREKVLDGEINVKYIHTEEQQADFLTKALTKEKFWYLCSLINLVEMPTRHTDSGSVGNKS